MFIPASDASASTVPATPASTAPSTAPSTEPPTPSTVPTTELVRHLLFGSPGAVHSTIRSLHKLGYAEVNDWSQPISTGKPNEVMAILTRRVTLESAYWLAACVTDPPRPP
ncbi:hypothetical protein [cf. Phormidesmis sp. LEGE 11477]|uniref:hypothetical protein n=1 Tax=cf. Phormidesmis sp. LEGE 11477 TaxID=1828680 RepID=UPI00187E5E56|nr:hypothetical protein [cf. Phormidesmis sp. LEGE 11477]MBE9061000.1 hypothetical protein [cf. Phormidesmis sp. LEGE 11477]